MQFFPKTQGVILTEKHLSFCGNFVHISKKCFSKRKNEIFTI